MNKLPDWIKIKKCKKVYTKDISGKENGFLIDILNRNDDIFKGREDEFFQQIYYSSVYKNMFKGFHIHPYKYDTVTCIFGLALLVFYPHIISKNNLNTIIDFNNLIIIPIDNQNNILTISFPSKYPHGYFGVSDISYLLNYRNPAWNPQDLFQYDYKCEGIETFLESWVINNAIS
jgi:dTDP-4-dehydrorhamnose 3,5-epimerase-like enzyme